MNRKEIKDLLLLSNLLINFKSIKNDEIIKAYFDFLDELVNENDINIVIIKYTTFIELYFKQKIEDFNIYLKKQILKKKIFYPMQLEKEIEILNKILKINYQVIEEYLLNNFSDFKNIKDYMPQYNSSFITLDKNDFIYDVEDNNQDIFSIYSAFVFDIDLEFKPIKIPEKMKFADLKGYQEQKRILYENTSALLEGKKVNNILLYGDAGCGKSTSVRALLNEFKNIKIVQIFKNNLINLDKLYSKLQNINHKFIIFADDISFEETDNNFSTLKAILEGSLIQCPDNAVIYATSNRKHLVKETFKSRMGDEIHLNDTINELNSLSERFGINLLFAKPNNEEFINIVLELAKDNDIDIENKLLIEKAQRLALIKGSTSPRVAKQLIDNLVAHVNI